MTPSYKIRGRNQLCGQVWEDWDWDVWVWVGKQIIKLNF